LPVRALWFTLLLRCDRVADKKAAIGYTYEDSTTGAGGSRLDSVDDDASSDEDIDLGQAFCSLVAAFRLHCLHLIDAAYCYQCRRSVAKQPLVRQGSRSAHGSWHVSAKMYRLLVICGRKVVLPNASSGQVHLLPGGATKCGGNVAFCQITWDIFSSN